MDIVAAHHLSTSRNRIIPERDGSRGDVPFVHPIVLSQNQFRRDSATFCPFSRIPAVHSRRYMIRRSLPEDLERSIVRGPLVFFVEGGRLIGAARAQTQHQESILGIEYPLEVPPKSGDLQGRPVHPKNGILNPAAISTQDPVSASPPFGIADVVGHEVQLALVRHQRTRVFANKPGSPDHSFSSSLTSSSMWRRYEREYSRTGCRQRSAIRRSITSISFFRPPSFSQTC